MAMARCKTHQANVGSTIPYSDYSHKPDGDGKAIICGRCPNPAEIVLTSGEEKDFEKGQRDFSLGGTVNAKVRVRDERQPR